MKLTYYIKELFCPGKCELCGTVSGREDGKPFCRECERELNALSLSRCSVCGLPTYKCECVLKVLRQSGFLFHSKLYSYKANDRSSTVNRLVYSMKRSSDRSLYRELAEKLAPEAARRINDTCSAYSLNPIITYVPRSRFSLKRYGFDQAKLLALALSEKLTVPCVEAVRRKKVTDAEMKMLSLSERFAEGSEAFEAVDGCGADTKTLLIIVDDVVTSGASVYSVANAARALGIDHFAVISAARAH